MNLLQHSHPRVECCRCSCKGCAGKKNIFLWCLTMGNMEVHLWLWLGKGGWNSKIWTYPPKLLKLLKTVCAWQWWPSPAGLLHGCLCRFTADGLVGWQDIFSVTRIFPLLFTKVMNLLLLSGWGTSLGCHLCAFWPAAACCQGVGGARSRKGCFCCQERRQHRREQEECSLCLR